MLRYIRSRIGNSYEIKNDDLNDFISYTKLAIHGYPQKVSCFNIDEGSGLMAIGNKLGRLQIFCPNEVQICLNIECNSSITSLHFIPGTNHLILLCTDKSRKGGQLFYRCQINDGQAQLAHFKQEIHLKRITCCEVLTRNQDGNSALLIGTIIGNIYALWAHNMEFTEYLVFLDTSLTQIDELNTKEQKSIEGICVHPVESSKLFLLFNNSIVVYFDIAHDLLLRKFIAPNEITHFSLHHMAKKLYCSHQNGYFSVWDVDNGVEETKKPFGSIKCSAMTKIVRAESSNIGEEFVIFSGGLPEEHEGRETITIVCGDKSLILDFDSPVLDFQIYRKNEVAVALFILCEEELVAIDLQDHLWRMFPLPYLCPIHSSPITCIEAISDLSSQANVLLTKLAKEQQKSSKIYSNNRWPLAKESNEEKKPNKDSIIIVTGHENGIVNIWLASDLSFHLWLSCNTARDFEGYREDIGMINGTNGGEDNNLFPPLRKAGVFDPFSDDHRLCIQRVHFDSKSGQFAVGGQAGQLMVYEANTENKILPANELLLLDMVDSCPDSFKEGLSKNEPAIQPRSGQAHFPPGFSLINNTIAQFKPPVPVSAISWNSNARLLAAGNEFGYAILSLMKSEVLLVRTLISSLDVIQIANKDNAISRFKSVKKSIRQSFRKKRQTNNSKQNEEAKPAERDLPRFNRGEREIMQRKANPNALDGETPNSLVKVLSFKSCGLHPAGTAALDTYLFVGTHGGRVLIHALQLGGEVANADQCPLIKEIRLQHQAPIVAIECLQQPIGGRLLVFSEEQIRSFLLPSLKPSNFKCRLTAIEGSRIRKAVIVLLNSRNRRMRNAEKFLAATSNRGEIFLFHPSNPKKPYKVNFLQPNDSTGIFSSVITQDGQLFYLKSGGSEFERFSINGIPPRLLH